MIGCRFPDGTDWSTRLPVGAYWRATNGDWMGLTPNGLLANLRRHLVTEHADGTITVAPSILVDAQSPLAWHGFLEQGIWRAV